jgi:DNA-directed RNA polymerase specialized sigma24 family protein
MPNHLSRSQWILLIDEWVFNEKDRAMLKRKMLDGLTYEQVAEEFDLSTQQTKARIKRAKNQLNNV